MIQFVAGVFLAVTLLTYTAFTFVLAEDRRVSRRLATLNSFERGEAVDVVPSLQPFGERFMTWLSELIGSFADRLAPHGYRARVKHKLIVAGSPAGMTENRFITIKCITAVLVGGLAVMLGLSQTIPTRIALVAIAPAFLGGYLLPNMWPDRLTQDRKKKMGRELPDMLDMLTISVEAGLGFDAALQKYVQSAHGTLVGEIGRTLTETRNGVSRTDALRRLGDRTEVPALQTLITSLVQADKLGTSLSTVLRQQSSELRLRRRQSAEEQAQKLPTMMVFPTIFCILPATMMVVLGPAVISLMHFFGS